MKKFFCWSAKISLIFALVFSISCQHDVKDDDLNIVIKGVKVGDQPCAENAEITVDGDEANVEVEFAENYAGLAVKIVGKNATLNGKLAKGKVKDITEVSKVIKIEASATGKTNRIFNFKVKKRHVDPTGIVISSVKVGGQPCEENAEITVDGDEANVEVEFAENYAGLAVKIAGKNATLNGKVAKGKVTGITEVSKTIKIEASATGKTNRTFDFKVKKGLLPPTINELIFEGKEINPTGTTSWEKDEKTYSSDPTKPPLLSEIKGDGTTKIGDARLPLVKVKVRYIDGATEQKLKVENTTTGTFEETNTIDYQNINVSIALKAGDNNLTITYSEKDKRPLVYKVVVGYIEPEYAPISLIKFNNEWYNTKKKFEALEAGTETLKVEGVPKLNVNIKMPELWYKEDGWKLTLDGVNIEKTELVKSGYSIIEYSLEKQVALTEGGSKDVKIIFENTARSYKKEYKITITHTVVNKIESIILIDNKSKNKINSFSEYGYVLNNTKQYYKSKDNLIVEDRIEKGIFLIIPQDKNIVPQYAFSNTEVDPSTISSWQALTKKSISFTNFGNTITEEAYAIEDHAINYGTQFLYIALEKASVKTYYVTEIEREKIALDNTDKLKFEKVYQDESGTKVDDNSPVAKKGLIRVLPKSPRAKVKLVTPSEQDFTLNSTDGYYECTIDLPNRETLFSYKIVAENTTTEKLYEGSDENFIKSVVVKDFKFNYKKEGNSWERKLIDDVDGKYYLTFDKNEVKENKVYLFLEGYKGLEVACAEFLNPQKEDNYSSTNYIFELDVASLMNATDVKKEYTANLTLQGKSLDALQLIVYLQDDVIQTLFIGYTSCTQLPDFKYLCKADLDSSRPRKIEVGLYFLNDETPENTNRKIRILEGGQEKTVAVNTKEKSKLEFVHDGIVISDKQKITLTIEYYADKNASSPTRTYTLNIEDI